MSDAEKQTLKIKLVKTPDGKSSCELCCFMGDYCLDCLDVECWINKKHFEAEPQIKIEIVEDKP